MTNVNKWTSPYTKDSSLAANRLFSYYESNVPIYNQNSLNRTNVTWWAVCRNYHISTWKPACAVMPNWWETGICPQCEVTLNFRGGDKSHPSLGDICHCSSETLFNFGCQCRGK